MLGAAENLSIRINGLDRAQIADMRRELFARLLTKRYDIDSDDWSARCPRPSARRDRQLLPATVRRGCASSSSSS